MPKNIRFILVGLGVLASILYLVLTGIQAQGVPYVKVAELLDGSDRETSYVKVTGKVKPGTLDYRPEVPLLKFSIVAPETDGSIDVTYEGIKPDALRESGHVILEGKYDEERGLLRAHTLLAKCPSRYKSKYESYDEKTSTSS